MPLSRGDAILPLAGRRRRVETGRVVVFGHVRRKRPSREELQQEVALALAARMAAGRPSFEVPRRSRPAWAGGEPTVSWYHSAAPVAPVEAPGTGPLLLRTVHLSSALPTR